MSILSQFVRRNIAYKRHVNKSIILGHNIQSFRKSSTYKSPKSPKQDKHIDENQSKFAILCVSTVVFSSICSIVSTLKKPNEINYAILYK